MSEQTTFLEPSYRRTSHGHRKIDGVQFNSYSTGILSYAQISSDGQIMVRSANAHRDGAPTYCASVIGHGYIKSNSGRPKRFRSEEAAFRAGVKVWKDKKSNV